MRPESTAEIVPRKQKVALGLAAEEIDEAILIYLEAGANHQVLANRLQRPIPWVGRFLKNEIVRSRISVLNELHEQSKTAKMVAAIGEVKMNLTKLMRGEEHRAEMAAILKAAEAEPFVEVASKGEVLSLKRDRVELLLDIARENTKDANIRRAASMDIAKVTGALDPKAPLPKSKTETIDRLIRHMIRAGIRPSAFLAKLKGGKPIDVDFIPESGDSGSSPNPPA